MAFEARPAGAAPNQDPAGAPAATLIGRLLDDATALVRNELALARAEFMQSANALKLSITSMAGGTIVLAGGVLTLIAAAVLALAEVVEPWLAALLVGVVLAVVGFLMIKAAKRKLAAASLDRTSESLRKDAAVAARRIR
jgi:uncharacterized membrane protein